MTEQKQIDPITLTVIWNTMLSIADELGTTLRHTAFSEGVREGDDFSTALFNSCLLYTSPSPRDS